jgi:hypothetical protein
MYYLTFKSALCSFKYTEANAWLMCTSEVTTQPLQRGIGFVSRVHSSLLGCAVFSMKLVARNFFFFFLAVMEFELRASPFLGKSFTS